MKASVTPLHIYALVAACWTLGVTTTGHAGPFLPRDESEVLERVPLRRGDPAAEEIVALRAALARDPADITTATEIAGRRPIQVPSAPIAPPMI